MTFRGQSRKWRRGAPLLVEARQASGQGRVVGAIKSNSRLPRWGQPALSVHRILRRQRRRQLPHLPLNDYARHVVKQAAELDRELEKLLGGGLRRACLQRDARHLLQRRPVPQPVRGDDEDKVVGQRARLHVRLAADEIGAVGVADPARDRQPSRVDSYWPSRLAVRSNGFAQVATQRLQPRALFLTVINSMVCADHLRRPGELGRDQVSERIADIAASQLPALLVDSAECKGAPSCAARDCVNFCMRTVKCGTACRLERLSTGISICTLKECVENEVATKGGCSTAAMAISDHSKHDRLAADYFSAQIMSVLSLFDAKTGANGK
mmetsp:Transcript_11539/g.22383  ORF Transcript_11539/g.22383 Transcript_11539/m.22383 type:complete len:325 (-) Transcript_11539:110-1084(-)